MDLCSFRPNNQSAATAIRFFKIILRKTLEDGNLKIPNKFTRKYGGSLQNPVYLKPPDGTEWKVHWTKNEQGILFEEGWKEFAAYYCLDHGHLLCFQYYKETSHFEVLIFGMSGLEIDYPGDDLVEILNEPLPCKRLKKRLESESPLSSSPSTSEKLRSATRTGRNPEGNQSEETELEKPSFGTTNQDLHVKNNRRKLDEALKEAKEFKSTNPSFIVNIKNNNAKGSSPPSFPTVFFREHIKKKKQNVKIQFGCNLWPARLIYYPSKHIAYICAGWPRFARANKLQAGDVCIFELVNREDLVFDIHLFRGNGYPIQ